MSKAEARNRAPPARLLRKIFDHHRWLQSHGSYGERLQIDNAEFFDLDLRGVDLSYAVLEEAHFRGGSLAGAQLVAAYLPWAKFENCELAKTNFSQSNLTRAAFLTDHARAVFEGSILVNTAWNRDGDNERTLETSLAEHPQMAPIATPPWARHY